MTAAPFPSGGEARADAIDRLSSARSELDLALTEMRDSRPGQSRGTASWRLAHAKNRVEAQEAWLAWVELAD